MASAIPSSQPRVSVAGDTFTSVGRVFRNISAGLALGASLTLASQLGGALAPAKAAVIVPTPLVYSFSLNQGDMAYGTYANFSHIQSVDPGFSVNVVIDGLSYGAETIFSPYEFGAWRSSTSALQGFWISMQLHPSSFYSSSANTVLGFLDRGLGGVGDGVFEFEAISRSGGDFEIVNPTAGDALIGFGYDSFNFSDPNLDGDSNPNTGLWAYTGNSQGSYFGSPGGNFILTVPLDPNSSGSSSVPGPLPVLGLAAAFGFSRKLRKRIKLHRGTSAVSTSPGA